MNQGADEEGYVTVEEEEEEANNSFDSQIANVSTENVTSHLRDLEISPFRNNSGSSSDRHTAMLNEDDDLERMDDIYPEAVVELTEDHVHKNGHNSEFTVPVNPAYEAAEEEKINGKCLQNINLSVDINYDYSSVKNVGYIMNVAVKQMGSGPIEVEIDPVEVDKNMQSDLSGYAADVSKTISSACSSTYIPPPPSVLTRLSNMSSTSGSSFAGAAQAVNPKRPQKAASLTKRRIEALKKRWENSDMLYVILDYLDKYASQVLGDGEVPKVELTVIEEVEVKTKKTRSAKASKRRNTSTDEPEVKRTKTEPKHSDFAIGSTVFAKWYDSKYYAGKVISKVNNNKWLIEFYDGKTKNVGSKQIVENYLHLVFGRRVMLMKDEKTRPSPALIVDCRVIKDQPMLLAVTNHGDYHVPISQVYFTDQHIRQVKAETAEEGPNKTPPKSCRVTRSQMKTSSPVPCTSGFKSNLRSGSSSELEEVLPDLQAPSPTRYVAGCEPEVLFYTPTAESGIKLKNISGKIPKSSTEVDDNMVGPIVRGDWFKGINFLLTCSNRCIETNVTDDTTDNEDYQFTNVPFVHDRLELQIKLGGGKIFTNVEDVKKSELTTTYLVAPKPCLTTKYIECLAMGVLPICHQWIVSCCKQQKKLPLQNIPLGWCVEDQKFINEYERKKGPALRGLRILIAYSTDRRFYDFWAKICSISGADVDKYSGECSSVDMVLVESGMRDDNLATAAVNGVCLVSTTWVIQSLIYGKSRNPDSHPMYHPNYEDFDAL